MSSRAFHEWAGARQRRIDDLYGAHAAVLASRAGARAATEQLNWAVVLRLAAEFQGFARDLHDEAADVLLSHVAAPRDLTSVLRAVLAFQRRLDSGNATRRNVEQDFGRFGFDLFGEVGCRYARAPDWIDALNRVNDARNGVGHAQPANIARAAGAARLGVQQARRWQASLRALARAMDTVTANELAKLTGGPAPW